MAFRSGVWRSLAGSEQAYAGAIFRPQKETALGDLGSQQPEQFHNSVPVAGGADCAKVRIEVGISQFRAPHPIRKVQIDLAINDVKSVWRGSVRIQLSNSSLGRVAFEEGNMQSSLGRP